MWCVSCTEMAGLSVPRDVRRLPATARLVYLALQDTPELTIDEIEAQTGAATRSVKQALAELRERDLVERQPHPSDRRRVLYTTADGPTEPATTPSAHRG